MSPRLALLGAFPFPVPQGSQVYFADQARALERTGTEVKLFTHGHLPPVLTPRRVRAGPSPMKPVADVALLRLLVRASRASRFDAVLAHNAEAALVALAARRWTGVPVVHVAHALWRHELPAYGPDAAAPLLTRGGRALDAFLAGRVDATLALCDAARRDFEPNARGPIAVIPPGFDPRPPPDDAEIEAACKRHALARGRYALYAGNLDRYQELPDLAAAASSAPEIPFAVVTHDPRGPATPPLRVIVADPDETRRLTHGAGVCLLPRRIPGGFPIKLLNYMEAARPIVARDGVADGFTHADDALLLGADDAAEVMAAHVTRLLQEPDLARRLGSGARALLERRHGWREVALATLALVDSVRRDRT